MCLLKEVNIDNGINFTVAVNQVKKLVAQTDKETRSSIKLYRNKKKKSGNETHQLLLTLVEDMR